MSHSRKTGMYFSKYCTNIMYCSEELGRPENKDLKGYVDKLAGVKKTIDEKGKVAGKRSIILACSSSEYLLQISCSHRNAHTRLLTYNCSHRTAHTEALLHDCSMTAADTVLLAALCAFPAAIHFWHMLSNTVHRIIS